jgi:hypothetical protein
LGRIKRDLGIERRTLVIFMNDNGGTVGCDLFNAGMRGRKGTAQRVCPICWWPARNLFLDRPLCERSAGHRS